MRINTKITFSIETGVVLARSSFLYEGPIEKLCGGPSAQQNAAASSQANLSNEESQLFQQYSAATTPFYENVLANGIPGASTQQQYSTSDLAQQINQAKANEKGKLAGYGDALPSGFASQEDADIGIGGAQAFDQNQLALLSQQFAAKMGAAQALNPQAPAAGASGANTSILQAPLQNNFWGNLISGLIAGGSQAGSAAMLACWIAEVLYGPKDIRTLALRRWVLGGEKSSPWRIFAFLYKKFGRRIADRARFSSVIRAALRPIFDRAWRLAIAE